MSAHHHADRPVSRVETRAHLRSERQRVRAELSDMTGPVDDDHTLDLDEPGARHRAERHHTDEYQSRTKDDSRHWKMPFWKRRTAMRKARNAARDSED